MTTPEVKENFPVCTYTGRLPEGQKVTGHHPIISVDIPPQASVLKSILAKSCAHMLGRVLGQVRCEKRKEVIGQR